MATIVTRSGKGSPLTNNEVDANFTNLNTELGTKANTSSLATVATTGAYADLTGKPTIASADGSVVVTGTTNIDLSVGVAGSTSNVVLPIRNTTGATLAKGTAVYISGATGQISTVSKAIATGDATSAQTLGLVTANIANNSNGNVTLIGTITNIDTSAYTDGQQLYLSPTTAGTLTATKPYAPQHLVYVAVVEHAHPSQGKLFVKVQNGYEMDELHDVSAQNPANNDGLFYNTSTSLWEKKSIATALGFTPYNATNPAGYITGITSGNVTTALGYTPANLAGDQFTGAVGFLGGSAVSTNGDFYARRAGGTTGVYYFVDGGTKYLYWDGGQYIFGSAGSVASPIDFRAPTFYDIANTAYYVDPNGTSQVNSIIATGYLETFSELYTRGNILNVNAALNGWNTIVDRNGGNPIVYGYNSVRAPIFYDSNDTGYYVDPNSTSRLSVANVNFLTLLNDEGLNVKGIRGQFAAGSDGQGISLFSNVDIGYPSGWGAGLGNTPSRGLSVYGGLRVAYSGGGFITSDTSVRSPIFYDSDNTSYYLDPASGTNLYGPFVTSGGTAMTGGWNRTAMLAATYPVLVFNSANTKYAGIGVDYTTASAALRFWVNASSADVVTGTNAMNINSGGYVEAGGSFRAPIFYDLDNTAYYVDPAGGSNLQSIYTDTVNSGVVGDPLELCYSRGNEVRIGPSGGNLPIIAGEYTRPAAGVGYLSGRYGSVEGNGTTGPIYCISTGYAPTASALGSMYGIGYTDGASSGVYAGTGWGMYVAAAGVARVFLDGSNGNAFFNGSARSPIFYDSNDTSYYVDPNSSSVLNTLYFRTGSVQAKFAQASNFGYSSSYKTVVLGNEYLTTISMGVDVSGNASGSFNGQGEGREVLFRNGVTFITPNSANNSYLTPLGMVDGYTYSAGSLRAPIFYDTDNTAYYIDPNSGSRMGGITADAVSSLTNVVANGYLMVGNGQASSDIYMLDSDEGTRRIHCNSNRIGFLTQAEGWGSYCSDNGDWTTEATGYASSSFRAPVFYDNDDTAYYINAASTSNLNKLSASGRSMVGSAQISMAGLDANTWYPVTIPIPVARQTTLRIENGLNSNAPSWSTHPSGFSCYIEWTTNGLGWGTIGLSRRVTDWREQFTTVQIVGGITQMTNSSTEVIWLRGGANYFFSADCDVTPTIQTALYTSNGQTVEPRSTVFNNPRETATGRVAFGSLQTNEQSLFRGNIDISTGSPQIVFTSTTSGRAASFGMTDAYNMLLNAPSGGVLYLSEFRAPMFRDNDNSAYYVDPASTSNLVGLTVANTITGSINGTAAKATDLNQARYANTDFNTLGASPQVFRAYTNYIPSGGSYNQPTSAGDFKVLQWGDVEGGAGGNGNWAGQIVQNFYDDRMWFRRSYGTTWQAWREFIHDGNYTNYAMPSGASATNSVDVRAPIFYDSADTGFFWNPATTSAHRLQTPSGYLDIGPMNTGYCHFQTDRARFYFAQEAQFDGGIYDYAGNWLFVDGEGRHNSSLRAPIFYDSDNTNYYINAASASVLNELQTFGVTNIYDVSTNHEFGLFFSAGKSTAYAIYREAGAWTHPYPDLRIAFHTGIKMGANAGYGGMKFYTDYGMDTQVMSINNGADGLGGGNVYVNNSLQAGGSLRAPIFYDSDNTGYYLDPIGTSYLNTVSMGAQTWRGDITWNNAVNIMVPASAECSFDVNSGGVWQVWDLTVGAPMIKAPAGSNVEIGQAGSRGLYVYGSITASGNVTAYSDVRIKANVETIPSALDKLDLIRGVTYTRTDLEDKEQRYAGVIAQEIEEVLPEAVRDHGDIKTVDYNATIALLIQAVKELRDEVEMLRK